MRRKNVLLTLWLIAPIAVFAGLYALIFVTLDKEKLMAEAKPIGAGAGDTGNANAIGQWLAGRDPDAISLATKAKRERLMISPTDWPGGVSLRLLNTEEDSSQYTLLVLDPNRNSHYMRFDSVSETGGGLLLSQELLEGAAVYLIKPGFQVTPNDESYVESTVLDTEGRIQKPLSIEPQIPPSDIRVEDPLPIYINVDSIP